MKILFTTDTIHRGGKERQLFILTRSLLDSGFDVTIVTRNFSKENYLAEYNLDNNITRFFKEKTWIKEFHLFKRFVISQKPEILVSWDLQTSLFALLLQRQYNYTFINASIQHGIRLLRLSHILRSIICFFSPNIIANSFAGLKANNLTPGEHKFVMYNGIENKFLNNHSIAEIETLRKKIISAYVENPGIVYISVANFVPYKDYFTVLKALSELKKQFSFYYLIIGDGPMRPAIEREIVKYGLENNVLLIGKTESVNDFLFASDVMIHSSRGEGISNAILEGMYAGLPVIATNVGGIPETVWPGSSVLFDYKNDKQLLDILLNLDKHFGDFDKNDPEYMAHLNKFSVDKMTKNFEEIIEKVMND